MSEPSTSPAAGGAAEAAGERGPAWLVVAAGLLAALLPLAVHWRLFVGQAVFYALDHAQLQYPRFAILCAALQEHGELPMWQHLLYGGAPFHANPEMPTLYPPALLFAALLDPVRTMNAFIALHMALGGLGAFLLGRHLWRARLARPGGVVCGSVAAAAFVLNYYARLENLNLVEYGAAHMLLPWIVLAIEGVLLGRRPAAWAGLLALLGGALANTGGLYVVLFGSLFCALWVVRFGLLGGPRARARTWRYVGAAVVAAGFLALAKLVPYFEWVPTTNRVEPVSEAIASARGLGGTDFTLGVLVDQLLLRTGMGVGLVLALVGVALCSRAPLVRFLSGVALVTTVFAAGPLYPLLYAVGPPFSLVRTGPDRLWTIVNVAWPLLAAFGAARLAELAADRLGRGSAGARARVAVVAALGLPLALLPPLLVNRQQFDVLIREPEPLSESIARYRRWPEVARRAGDEWRVWWVGKPTDATDGEPRTVGGKNEQFITTALGVETLGGFLGYVWPRTLERHLYWNDEGLLDEQQRTRRAGVLSARFLVSNVGPRPRGAAVTQTDPPEVEGRRTVENPWARPRATAPRAVVGVFGDASMELCYRLLDDLLTPIDVSVVAFAEGEEPTERELALLDLVVLVDGAEAPGGAPADVPVVRCGSRPSPDDWRVIGEALGHEGTMVRTGTVLRDGPNRTRVVLEPSERDRFVVLSETWSTNPGWSVTVDGEPVPFRRADGIVSAVAVPAGAREVAAAFRAPGARTGLLLGGLGLVLVAVLVVRGLAGGPARDGSGPG